MILQKRIAKVGIKGDAHVVITSGDYEVSAAQSPFFCHMQLGSALPCPEFGLKWS